MLFRLSQIVQTCTFMIFYVSDTTNESLRSTADISKHLRRNKHCGSTNYHFLHLVNFMFDFNGDVLQNPLTRFFVATSLVLRLDTTRNYGIPLFVFLKYCLLPFPCLVCFHSPFPFYLDFHFIFIFWNIAVFKHVGTWVCKKSQSLDPRVTNTISVIKGFHHFLEFEVYL